MKVILIEFNELCPPLMDRFIAEGKLPNFARFRGESEAFITDAEEKAPHLEPWIQWVTVHSGLPYREHQVVHLGDGHDSAAPRIWDIASRAGKKVWVCGSMNSSHGGKVNGAFLPDPWAFGSNPYPASLEPFFRFIRTNVQEHTRSSVGLGAKDYAAFLYFMARNGLSASTVGAILRQFLSERGGRNRWKRAVLLDRLQFDLFRSVYRKTGPEFSTFFSNSTAHFQHCHWRHMDPGIFKVKPAEREMQDYESAILYGYQQMDGLVGEFFRLADADTALILCTALSQQPCLVHEDQGGKVIYRPTDFDRLVRFAGLTVPFTVEPVMAEEFHLRFQSESDALAAERQFDRLTVDGRKAMRMMLRGKDLFLGCGVFTSLPDEAMLLKDGGQGEEARFGDLFYQLGAPKSGMHHPDGLLWIRRPGKAGSAHSEKISIRAVAPTILNLLGLPVPREMQGVPLEMAA